MRSRRFGPVLIALMVAFALWAYARLPARIPVHWNVEGTADGWAGKWMAFLLPIVALAIWALLMVLPRIDPRKRNYERFEDTYMLVVNTVVVFMAVIEVVTLGAAMGWPLDVTRALLLMMGVLFVAIGNFMPRLRPNWWMGIRTPWTLESDTVWRETHRLGGRTMMGAGLVAIACVALPSPAGFWVAFTALMVAALIPLGWSYVLWRRERRAG